jgi:phosphoserine phosphatase
MDELKEVVAKRDPSDKKFTKDLWGAYEVAAEEHDLAYFKGMLVEHEKNLIQLREEEAEKEQKKADAAEKKAKRKSTASGDAEGDVTMEDAVSEEAPKKAKKTPKRKAEKDVEVDEEDKVTTISHITEPRN